MLVGVVMAVSAPTCRLFSLWAAAELRQVAAPRGPRPCGPAQQATAPANPLAGRLESGGFAVLPRSGFSASVSFNAGFLLGAAGRGPDASATPWDLLGS